MCGINGFYTYGAFGVAPDERSLLACRDSMRLRGPDSFGHWIGFESRVGLAHRRLAIIDLDDRAAQPMATGDDRLKITFNGEIYNYKVLKSQLEQKGSRFRTQSDTEVLLHLYAAHGQDMIQHLRGMFAFAIWDEERAELFLARDPYGIKPLYYSDHEGTFRFASQVKAMVAGGGIPSAPDAAGWAGFFLYGSVPEPYTTLAGVRALPAGSFLRVGRNGPAAVRTYHSVAAVFHGAGAVHARTADDASGNPLETMRAAMLESVRSHLVADVPVGAFLSAGTDSGALVGLMRDCGQSDIQTLTLAFDEFKASELDEAHVAAEVARGYGTRHTTRRVTEGEFIDELPKFLAAMDQPTIDGVNTWFVAKAAHELGLKVAISGVGGDELLGGYPSFQFLPRTVRWMQPFQSAPDLSRRVRQSLGAMRLDGLGLSPKSAGMAELGGTYPGAYLLKRGLFMPWELPSVMSPDMAREGLESLQPLGKLASALVPDPGTSFGRVATLEAAFYMRNQLLRDTDWASMAHSLEVRTPLVDSTLLSQLAGLVPGLGTGVGKRLLRSCPRQPLPASVGNRRKSGFTVPLQSWMAQAARRLDLVGRDALPAGSHWSRRWAMLVSAGHLAPTA